MEDISMEYKKNIMGQVFTNLQDLKSHQAQKERYNLALINDVQKFLVENIRWDEESRKVVLDKQAKLIIGSEDEVIFETVGGFMSREGYMDDDEILKVFRGLWSYFELENQRDSFKDHFMRIQKELKEMRG